MNVPAAASRIGLGFDIHRLEEGRELRLGGVVIPHDRGPRGHSDGDVLLHALCDAVLGAAGEEDLGALFPDRDPRWEGEPSATFAREAARRARARGLRVGGLDAVVLAEAPRLAPHREAIRRSVAALFGCPPGAVSVKGKTMEGLGAIGRGEAIAAQAVALLVDGAEGLPDAPD